MVWYFPTNVSWGKRKLKEKSRLPTNIQTLDNIPVYDIALMKRGS